jgi:hypothetical protein
LGRLVHRVHPGAISPVKWSLFITCNGPEWNLFFVAARRQGSGRNGL